MRFVERLITMLVLPVWYAVAAQAQPSDRIVDLVFRREDLVFRVEDLGNRVQVHETAAETRIELPADILFEFDRADIRAAAKSALKQAADLIRRKAKDSTMIIGHTDAKGSTAYNQKLSEQRAAAVEKWLVEREGLSGPFQTKGLGATRPIAPNTKSDGSDDPEGRQRNRRVEIVIGGR